MWYVIKTDYFKEREAIRDLLQLDSIEDLYFPTARPKLSEIGKEEKNRVSFRPVINGILFVYAPDAKLLRKDLNASGYFLRKSPSSIVRREQVAGNAHLFLLEDHIGGLKSMLAHARISDEEIYRYKVCVEQCAAHTDDIKIVGKDYAELAANNDIVMITNGPFAGYTGVIKQVKRGGVKDRCFLFSLGDFCVQLSGIRRYGVVVVRESAHGPKAQLPNTWRYIDYLQGKLQASYFADNSSFALRHILEQYNKAKDTETCQSLLLREARRKPTEAESRETALQAVWLMQASDDELAALKSLSRFFQSTDNSVAFGLSDLIPDMPLRPFLTPTSGVALPKGKNYILFPHDGFVELIFRVNLKHEFQKAENPPCRLSREEYIYYVHVGLWDDEDQSGVTAMVNWGEFAHRYHSLVDEERDAFLHDLLSKGYLRTHSLLSAATLRDKGPALSGFACHMPHVHTSTLYAQYVASSRLSISQLRAFVPVARLVRRCIPSAVEFWQSQRLLEWRHLVQRYVLLHNLPLKNS